MTATDRRAERAASTARRFTVRPGRPAPARRDARRRGHELRALLPARDVGRAAALRAPRRAQAGQDHPARPERQPDLLLLARLRRRRDARACATPTGSTARRTCSGAGHRFNPNKVLIDPYARGTTSTLWDRVAACGPDDNVAHVDAQRRHRHDDYDWEGDQPLRPPDAGDGHLRDARPRLHQVADVGRAAPGDLPRRDREDPLPPEARRHRGRAAARLRVRRGRDQRDEPAHRPAAHQLLGLQPDQLLRPPRGLLRRARGGRATSASSATWSRPSTRPASR